MNKNELTHKDIINYLVNQFPLNLAEDWDQSGLKKFSSINTKITKILICLDVTQDVINFAIKQKANLIISHHPIFINSKEIKTNSIDLKNLKLLKKAKINLLSLHTNVDNNKYGLNYYLSKKLNLGIVQISKSKKYQYCKIKLTNFIKHDELINLINLKFKTLRKIYLSSNDLIKNIYICSGSGYSILNQILNLSSSDLLITGDVKWHDWIYISQSKYHVIDVGHDLEKYFINLILDKLNFQFKNLKLLKYYPSLILKTLK